MSTPPATIGIDASRANRSRRTGVEWYAFHLIQRLKTVIPADVRVVLYSEEPLRDGLEALPPNWESRVLRWPPRRLWTQVRLSWEMLVRPPSLLFVPAHLPPLFTPRRVLTTLHDTAFVTMPEAYNPFGSLYLQFMYRVAVWAGHVLTVSEFSKGELVRLFGAKPERVHVTYLGYDDVRYGAVPAERVTAVLAKYGLAQPYFLFVGRLETKKNLAGLLQSFRRYRRQHPENAASLVLVGTPGHGYEHDMAAAMDDDIRPHVIQPGYVAPEDMAALYAGAVGLTFVSRYEGFGIPLLEAFACGTPVIASNVTSLPEIAGTAALYVDPNDHAAVADAMARLQDGPTLATGLRQKGTERVKEFSWDAAAAKTWEVMRQSGI